MENVLQKVIEIAALEFDADPSTLTAQSTPDGVKGWDSEAQLRLTMAAEQEFDISFTIDEFESIASLGDLADLTVRKKNLRPAEI